MTNLESHDAAALLDEVERRRLTIRRRMGNGWFELAVFGSALLVAGLAGFVGSLFGAVQAIVCAVVIGAAYVAVITRNARLHRDFGVSLGLGSVLIGVAIYAACTAAARMLDGTARSLVLALLPVGAVLAMALWWQQKLLVQLGGVMLAGGLVGLAGAPGWAVCATYGAGFVGLALLALRQVDGAGGRDNGDLVDNGGDRRRDGTA